MMEKHLRLKRWCRQLVLNSHRCPTPGPKAHWMLWTGRKVREIWNPTAQVQYEPVFIEQKIVTNENK
jgi:hypothetical protein